MYRNRLLGPILPEGKKSLINDSVSCEIDADEKNVTTHEYSISEVHIVMTEL